PHVTADAPAGLLQPLQERADTGLKIWIVCGGGQEYPDAPHPLRLLRARRKRPHGRRATEKRDELATLHCSVPPVLPTERIAYLGCQIGVDSSPRSLFG